MYSLFSRDEIVNVNKHEHMIAVFNLNFSETLIFTSMRPYAETPVIGFFVNLKSLKLIRDNK